jgi:hypothetical protein
MWRGRKTTRSRLDLFLDYASNVALYPRFQEYFRTKRLPLWRSGARTTRSFVRAAPRRSSVITPTPKYTFYDTGNFALETHVHEIAAAIRDFRDRHPSPTKRPE